MFARRIRSSRTFMLVVICVANFSDVFIYGLVVPVMPFALTVNIGVDASRVQLWNSLLLGILGGAIAVGSGTCYISRSRLLSVGGRGR